ncbi:MAG: SulP family inorganic anion transporter [Myxococcota bacterium]|nr:SulP family inorganic anion transporter [Myxococcota bacterium]
MGTPSPTPVSFADHFRFLKSDLPAGVVVFLVALPLCLGVAHASKVPPLAGVISGLVGGIVVGLLSGSHKAVSGPAAGLIVIVLGAVEALGYPGLLLATFLAGGLQLLLGVARFGGISTLFPPAVVRGMLVAIGLILVLKQIPHAVGYSGDFEGDEAFWQADGRNTLTEIPFALGHFHVGAVLISLTGLALILLKERIEWLKNLRWIPGPLLAVAAGMGLNELFHAIAPSLAVGQSLVVQMPVGGIAALQEELAFPDFGMIGRADVWGVAVTLAIIASIETLLSIEALDSLDPDKRVTPTNRELVAQGAGNLVAPLMGGIPLTAVIVRGTANVSSGARTRSSTVFHGLLLLVSILALAPLMNRIPLAALAAVLLQVGYKLASPAVFVTMLRRAPAHWVPFLSTVLLILFTDLLTGVVGGFVVAVGFIVIETLRVRRATSKQPEVQVRLAPTVPWLSKLALRQSLTRVDEGGVVVIDGSNTDVIHPDVRREIEAFIERAREKRIEVRLRHLPDPNAVAAH